MARKFSGTLEELQQLISAAGILGEWETQGGKNPKHVFRSEGGGVLNWWPSTRTVNIQGDKDDGARLAGLLEDVAPDAAAAKPVAPADAAAPAVARPQVFVVYGHDKQACLQLENALLRLECDPFVLGKTSGGGKTIIEALEGKIGRDNQSTFGVALVAPDDMGCAKDEFPDNAMPRARENVILETGMLLASLTRARVALLVKGPVALPSDLQGVIYIAFNDRVGEAVPKLCEHMVNAGIPISPHAMAGALASLTE